MLTKIEFCNGERAIPVKLTLSAARIYQAQFNRDLFSDLHELAMAINSDYLQEAVKLLNYDDIKAKTPDELMKKVIENLDLGQIAVDRPLTLAECERGLEIVWAFAKNADKSIPLSDDWLDSLDVFPVRILINQLFDKWTAVQNGTIDLKNA